MKDLTLRTSELWRKFDVVVLNRANNMPDNARKKRVFRNFQRLYANPLKTNKVGKYSFYGFFKRPIYRFGFYRFDETNYCAFVKKINKYCAKTNK
jgi:hypothetical protein